MEVLFLVTKGKRCFVKYSNVRIVRIWARATWVLASSRKELWEDVSAPKLNERDSEMGESAETTMEQETQQENRPESRLIITKIVNENFKSYAGRQELGPFHKVCGTSRNVGGPRDHTSGWSDVFVLIQSFSSIVGPNGSGKSNVIDAMLFVFGYRSKKIRSKKLSQLIHNSENHQNIQSCTVAVHFQTIIDLVMTLVWVCASEIDVLFCTSHGAIPWVWNKCVSVWWPWQLWRLWFGLLGDSSREINVWMFSLAL